MAGLKKMTILCGVEFFKGKCKDEEEKKRVELFFMKQSNLAVKVNAKVNDKDNVQVAITFTEQ